MLRPGGHILGFGPGVRVEVDTFTCSHCQRVTPVPVKCAPEDLGGHCRCCDKLICSRCVETMHRGGNCVPWEKAMEKMEAREAARRSYGL